jgi:hypothetical protein
VEADPDRLQQGGSINNPNRPQSNFVEATVDNIPEGWAVTPRHLARWRRSDGHIVVNEDRLKPCQQNETAAGQKMANTKQPDRVWHQRPPHAGGSLQQNQLPKVSSEIQRELLKRQAEQMTTQSDAPREEVL